MLAPDEADAPDVLPPVVNQVLATLWILLMGGRWLATPWLMTYENLGDLDDILYVCYFVLLVITLIVLVLRFLRRRRLPTPLPATPEPNQPAHADASQTQGAPNRPPNTARSSKPRD
jgi:hypothetical protein